VGYGLCSSPDLVAAVERVRQPFVVNVAAAAAATEALRHPGETGARIAQARESRGVVAGGLRALGIEPAASEANFCWFDLPAGEDAGDDERGALEQRVIAGLREQGVLVRSGGALGRPGALRVTYGTPAENERFLAALGGALA
jgi:histidinol-phosphate aminotransferase